MHSKYTVYNSWIISKAYLCSLYHSILQLIFILLLKRSRIKYHLELLVLRLERLLVFVRFDLDRAGLVLLPLLTVYFPDPRSAQLGQDGIGLQNPMDRVSDGTPATCLVLALLCHVSFLDRILS